VRAFIGGDLIADTARPLLVWEKPYYPTYYFPLEDVAENALVDSGETERSPSRGTASIFDIRTAAATTRGGAYRYPKSPIEEIRDHVALRWESVDHWFEEDEEIFVHPRDPYTRVDVLRSSRRVRIEVGGVTVADSTHPTLLFETGLPVRYYLPKTDVHFGLLRPTDTVTQCPYKGNARYWSLAAGDEVHEDVVWGYDFPVRESAGIAGLVAFYDEKVDVYVDGELQERPSTAFG
jgi:uncharacterized protein (DUF427 family)